MTVKTELARGLDALGQRSDDELAALAVRGSGPAFTELARRHSRLVAGAMGRRVPGLGSDDLRQEALVGLLEACHAGREPGSYTEVAEACVRRRVRAVHAEAVRSWFAVLDRPVVIGWPLPDTSSASAREATS